YPLVPPLPVLESVTAGPPPFRVNRTVASGASAPTSAPSAEGEDERFASSRPHGLERIAACPREEDERAPFVRVGLARVVRMPRPRGIEDRRPREVVVDAAD